MIPTPETGAPRERILVVAVGVLVLLIGMATRVAHLTIVERDELVRRAKSQYEETIHMAAPRGQIRDREGTIFADTVGMPSIYASPKYHRVAAEIRPALAKALDLPRSFLDKKLDSNAGFVWLKRHVTREQAQQVERLRLPGVESILEGRRVYPLETIGAHVVGTAGTDMRGLEGIELRYDKVMRGEELVYRVERDGRGRSLFTEGVAAEQSDERAPGPLALDSRLEAGATLELTIDAGLQEMAERELAAGVQAANADAGTAIILDPHSGAILALANYPWFDPNKPGSANPQMRRNRAVTDSFEPGSTLKAVLAAAALDEGVVDPDDRVFCENGKLRIGKWTINDHHPYGLLTIPEVIQYSSNIGVSKIAEKLGRERYFRYLQNFGFGKPTSVDLPGEVGGIVRPLDRWAQIDLATSSFGQGISVTAIQMAAAYGAIANGGRLHQPYLLERAIDTNTGKVLLSHDGSFGEAASRDVIRPQTAREIGAMLERVVEMDGGTGKKARIPGVRVAGKTGTAQKVDSKTRRYSSERLASFVGYAPADDPMFVTLVMIDNPKGGEKYGGLVAAPVFSAITSRALDRFGRRPGAIPTIVPASTTVVTGKTVKQPAARDAKGVTQATKRKDAQPAAHNDGLLMAATFKGPVDVAPSFTGMSLRNAMREAQRLGLRLEARGSGFIVAQDPPAGTPLHGRSEASEQDAPPRAEMCEGGDRIVVRLEPAA